MDDGQLAISVAINDQLEVRLHLANIEGFPNQRTQSLTMHIATEYTAWYKFMSAILRRSTSDFISSLSLAVLGYLAGLSETLANTNVRRLRRS